MKSLEIPKGKRTAKYRFFEILPGFLSILLVFLLFFLSWLNPLFGAIYIFLLISAMLVKAIGVAFRTFQGFKVMRKAERVDWAKRLDDLNDPHDSFERLHGQESTSYGFDQHVQNLRMLSTVDKENHPNPNKIYNAIIMVAYNEELETLIPSVEAVKNTTFDNQKIIFVFAYEERGGPEMEARAEELKRKFGNDFYDFLLIKHPDNLRDEIKGKGPNLTYAGKKLSEYVAKKKIPSENVIVTSLDSDNRMSEKYLAYITYEFVTHPNRQHISLQPISLFMNNIWDAPAPMRVVAISNSFFNIITTMRPHALRNFASHSQPLAALEGMNYWSKRTIVEDGHQYWRSLFYFNGDYEVIPIRVPIYQDAVISDSLWATIKAQFVQVRRWDYGASDVAYVGVRLFSKDRKMPFWPLFTKFVRLLDGHVMLAILAPIAAFGGWIPMLMNLGAKSAVAYNLPTVVGTVQMIATIGLLVTILTSMKMLPPRPKKYRKQKTIVMIIQWILMPVVAIIYQSVAAFYAQIRLMLGFYMEKFDVTKKVVKK